MPYYDPAAPRVRENPNTGQLNTHWTKTHIRWIRALKFEHPAHHILIEENLAAIRDSQDRLERLEQQIMKLLSGWAMAPVVQATNLGRFRSIGG
jgi:hypothetical protein